MRYTLNRLYDGGSIMVVGCGGTGGYVAEGVARLIKGKSFALYLVDHDRVEDRNLVRQNFYPEDLGKFKAEALASRLSEKYGMPVYYIVKPIEQLSVYDRCYLTIGCVDNGPAREVLQYASAGMNGRRSYCRVNGWYIDAGNGEYSGQVLIGNSLLKEMNWWHKAFYPETGTCYHLPLPQVQQPGLLVTSPKPEPSCAEAVEADEQSPVINRVMADLVLTFVHRLIQGTLGWMGAYIDLEAGAMSTVDATPENVSRITGHTVRQLEYRPRKSKENS